MTTTSTLNNVKARARARAKTATKVRVTRIRPAGPHHQVITSEGGTSTYRRQPCPTCPWRIDAVGEFPAEAFRHSAPTAYDMAKHVFSCHESGSKKPSICAGFLLRGADHNMAVRIKRITGEIGEDVSDAGLPLHDSYRAMAEANGVDADEVVLAQCR